MNIDETPSRTKAELDELVKKLPSNRRKKKTLGDYISPDGSDLVVFTLDGGRKGWIQYSPGQGLYRYAPKVDAQRICPRFRDEWERAK